MDRKALTNKLIVVGVDGLDPRLAKKYLDAGEMPNMKALLDKGVAREDLVLLGAVPTITPPMWTTLATGAYPITHGITCFTRQSKKSLDTLEYNLDSAGCLAEQIWNVTAEAGLKTLVLHWPGSSWPPTSDSENLYVVDGTQPAGINFGVAAVDSEKIVVADVKTAEPAFKEKAAADSKVPCVIEDLNTDDSNADIVGKIAAKEFTNVMLSHADGEGALSDAPFDVAISPIKDAQNWAFELPEDAKEFTVLHSAGLVRRPCIILKNEQGVYDRVVMYKSKKNDEPVAVLPYNVFVSDIIDDAIKGDVKYMANRSMRLLELSPDGSHLKLWVSMAMDITNDTLWHPTSLFKTVTDAVGYPQPVSLVGGADQQLIY